MAYLKSIPKIKVLVLDALNLDAGVWSHMGLTEALQFARELQPDTVYFIGRSTTTTTYYYNYYYHHYYCYYYIYYYCYNYYYFYYLYYYFNTPTTTATTTTTTTFNSYRHSIKVACYLYCNTYGMH